MAKKIKATRFSIQGFDLNHYRTTEQYAAAVQALFDRATEAIARSAAAGNYDPNQPFSFDMDAAVQREMQKVVNQLASQLTTTITTGSRKQWLFACEKNDDFLASIMDTSKLSKARLKKMQDRNLDALATFQGRKVNGMNLSQRVWQYVGQYKDQLEAALDVGLGEGRSAQQLARDVKKNLRDPNRLFRRVRDKNGNLVLSKAAKAFHPGQGVYRSSVKNAQRLTRSEINMAYRESDFLRWQQLDFVVGFEIHRSNHKPLCKCKLCERLQGRYPKTFKFKGWHPQCMCYCTPILMDEETFDENELGDLKAALYGTEYKKKQAKNVVTDVPDEFKAWVEENLEASKGWSSTPYFIKDNFVDGDLSKGLKIDLPTVKPDAPGDDLRQAALNAFAQMAKESKSAIDAIMPDVEAARKLAKDWDLVEFEDLFDDLIDISAVDDLKELIQQVKTKVAGLEAELQKYWADAHATTNEAMKLSGISSMGQVLEDVRATAKNKGEWTNNKRTYLANLERLKADIKNAKSGVNPEMSAFIADADQLIALCASYPKIDLSLLKMYLEDVRKNGVESWNKRKDTCLKYLDRGKRQLAGAKDLDAREETDKTEMSGWHTANETATIVNDEEQKALETILGISRGVEMSHEQADNHRANDNFVDRYICDDNDKPIADFDLYPRNNKKYHINCQSCVVAYELRRRGYDVTAQGNTPGSTPSKLSHHTEMIWRDEDGKIPKSTMTGGIDMLTKFEALTKTPGRYHIKWQWKGQRSGHIIVCERLKDGTLRIFDPQCGREITDFTKYSRDFDGMWGGISVLRVDGLKIDGAIIADVVKGKKAPKKKKGKK